MVNAPEMRLDSKAPPAEVSAILREQSMREFNINLDLTPRVVKRIMDSLDTGIVICRIGDVPAGYIIVKFLNPMHVRVGFGFFRPARGAVAKRFLMMMADKLFSAGVIKISGEIAPDNRACLQMVASIGAKREGLNRASAIINGHVSDMVYMGITLEDWSKKCLIQ